MATKTMMAAVAASFMLFSRAEADLTTTAGSSTTTADAITNGGVAVLCGQVANTSQNVTCLGYSDSLNTLNLSTCADAHGAAASDIPCCFDTNAACESFANSTNTARSPICGVGQYTVANASSSGLRTCSETKGGWGRLLMV